MNLKQFKWILGGSYNIVSVIHCYAIDYLTYPQHLKAKIQEISMLLRGEYKWRMYVGAALWWPKMQHVAGE